MFLTIFILTAVLVGIALLGLAIQVIFSKKKNFPETKVGHNKEMRKRKIYCIKTQQVILDKKYKQKKSIDMICSDC